MLGWFQRQLPHCFCFLYLYLLCSLVAIKQHYAVCSNFRCFVTYVSWFFLFVCFYYQIKNKDIPIWFLYVTCAATGSFFIKPARCWHNRVDSHNNRAIRQTCSQLVMVMKKKASRAPLSTPLYCSVHCWGGASGEWFIQPSLAQFQLQWWRQT